jgi:hypothetical protein
MLSLPPNAKNIVSYVTGTALFPGDEAAET